MSDKKIAAIVLAAGAGTRMQSSKPKVMHEVGGRPLIKHLLIALQGLKLDRIVVVIGGRMPQIAAAVSPATTVVQSQALGTAHAVMAAREAMRDFDGDVLVLFGDTPLIRQETLQRMVAARRGVRDPAVVVLGFSSENPAGYGRLIISEDGVLESIVEARDATPEQLDIPVCNSGIMAFDGERMFGLLDHIGNANAQGEFYLTDVVQTARASGFSCDAIFAEETELLGVNSREDLIRVERVFHERLRHCAAAGERSCQTPTSSVPPVKNTHPSVHTQTTTLDLAS